MQISRSLRLCLEPLWLGPLGLLRFLRPPLPLSLRSGQQRFLRSLECDRLRILLLIPVDIVVSHLPTVAFQWSGAVGFQPGLPGSCLLLVAVALGPDLLVCLVR